MPLVTSGMATMPPVPVDTVAPVPSRLNQVSIVNVAAFKPGAGPNVTRLLVPSNRSALFEAEFTVMVAVSLTLYWPSLADSANTYVPPTEKVAVVTGAFALPKVVVPGPLTWLQVIVSDGPSTSTAVPFSAALAGIETLRSSPAFTTGASFTAASVIATVATGESAVPSLA